MSKEDISIINIFYNINEKDKKNGYINIFGSEFVENNKNICKMIIDNKEYEISENYNIKSYNKNKLEIKLKGINNVTNLSEMFYNCKSLSSLHDISNWNTNKVTKKELARKLKKEIISVGHLYSHFLKIFFLLPL